MAIHARVTVAGRRWLKFRFSISFKLHRDTEKRDFANEGSEDTENTIFVAGCWESKRDF